MQKKKWSGYVRLQQTGAHKCHSSVTIQLSTPDAFIIEANQKIISRTLIPRCPYCMRYRIVIYSVRLQVCSTVLSVGQLF